MYIAKFPSTCPKCGRAIKPGTWIIKPVASGRWWHAKCHQPKKEKEARKEEVPQKKSEEWTQLRLF